MLIQRQLAQEVRARIEAYFTEAVMGRRGGSSEWGVAYDTYVNGHLVQEGGGDAPWTGYEDVLDEVREWCAGQNATHRLVWREVPEVDQEPERGLFRARWRCHTMPVVAMAHGPTLVPLRPPVNEEAVKRAKALLADCEAGRVVEFFYGAVCADGSGITAMTATADQHRRLGVAGRLVYRMNQLMDKTAENSK